IHALETIQKVAGQLPVRVKLFVEGDEETGSPSMKKLSREEPEAYREMTRSDLCLWEGGITDDTGRPWIRYGVRGSCAFELSVKTADMDCHGRMGATVPSASWRLIWALGTLKTQDERIQIEGFYDDVVEATEADLEVLRRFPYEEEALKKRMGFDRYLLDATGDELKRRFYMEPVLSVCGLEAGELYNGPRGIVPHKAMARISFYLVADQDPERVHRLLREHLDRNGFSDVQIAYKGGSGAVRTPVDMPFTQKLFEAAKQVYSEPMVLELTQLGAGPAACFRKPWPQMPIVSVGTANGGSNHHAPDENIRVEDYRRAVKYIIALLYSCAG
ncbi:MAG: M20/M25/M40 family metallo-hydrolase, partial [Clostridium sp.]|nr:M20/M25/M40 family metallo-hydrolase [Clostridium sp.]